MKLRSLLMSVFALTIAVNAAQSADTKNMKPADAVLASNRPMVIAHRGFSAEAPENTIAAFEMALAAKADLIELDYYHSQDGKMAVIHDSTLDRTTDATQRWGGKKLRAANYEMSELKTLDVGSWFSKKFADQRLPDLAESLKTIQRGSITLIERKAGDAKTCVELIREMDLVNDVIVQAFDWAYLKDYRRLEPTQILGALGPRGSRNGKKLSDDEKRLNKSWVDEVHDLGAQLVVWNSGVSRDSIAYAHRRGLKVWVYTINEEAQAKELFALGVDGIITNKPDMLRKVVDELMAKRGAQ